MTTYLSWNIWGSHIQQLVLEKYYFHALEAIEGKATLRKHDYRFVQKLRMLLQDSRIKKARLTVVPTSWTKNCQLSEPVAGPNKRLCTQQIFVTLTVEEGQRIEVGVSIIISTTWTWCPLLAPQSGALRRGALRGPTHTHPFPCIAFKQSVALCGSLW